MADVLITSGQIKQTQTGANAKASIDAKYGPYIDLDDALSKLTPTNTMGTKLNYLTPGLTIGVYTDNTKQKVVEYIVEGDVTSQDITTEIFKLKQTDISGKADANSVYTKTEVDNALGNKINKVTEAAGKLPKLKSDGTLESSGIDASTVITDITGKANKVSNATANNFAALDGNGDLIDSGKSATSFATAEQGGKADTALQPAQTATGLLKNDGTVDTETAGKANSAVQPVTTATEDNFAAFDENGNIKDGGCNEDSFIKGVQQNGADLTKDANGKVNVTVQDGEDGKSAYEIWYDENGYDDPSIYNKDYFLASLKAQFGSFVPALYCTDTGHEGKPGDSNNNLITPDATTLNYIYLIDNDDTTPTAKTMWITVVDDSDPDNIEYDWTSIGDVQVDLTFGSGQVLSSVKIKDQNGEEVIGDADVLSAEAGVSLNMQEAEKMLNSLQLSKLNRVNILAREFQSITSNKQIQKNDGDVKDNAGQNSYITDFIEVNDDSIYMYKGNASLSTYANIACYDSNQQFVRAITFDYENTPREHYVSFEKGIKYVRLSLYHIDYHNSAFFEFKNADNIDANYFEEIRKSIIKKSIDSALSVETTSLNTYLTEAGKTINPDTGELDAYSNQLQKVSSLIEIDKNAMYLYKGGSITADFSDYSFYDAEGVYISNGRLSTASGVTVEIKIIPPIDAKYIRFSMYNPNSNHYLKIVKPIANNGALDDITDLNDSVIKYRVNSDKENLSIGVTYTTSKVINPSTGLLEDYNNSLQKVSDYISVDPKYLYEYHGASIIAGKANYAIYDSSQNLISVGLSTNSKVTQKICLPQNAAYIRLSYYNKLKDDYFIKYIPFEDTKDLVLSPKSVKLGFDKTVLAYWDSTNDILTSSEAINTSGNVISALYVSYVSDLITIEEGAIYKYRGIAASTSYLRVAYYSDAEGTQFTSGETQLTSTDVGEFVLNIPTGAVTFRCSFYDFYNIKYKQYLYKYTTKKEAINLIELDKRDEEIAQINKINHWKGKIMCAFGASGTYGATAVSFPVEVGKILDCTVRNFAKSSPMRYYDNSLKTSGDYQGKSVGLSSTIAEWESEGYSGTSIRSWENYFTQDLDLVIFGEGDSNCPGGDELIDLIQLPTQNNKHYTYSNGDTLAQHRDSYIGALVYLLDKLWGINPACRVVFTNDYLYIGNYSNASGLRNRTKALCEKLCLPNIQIWQKLGWSWYNQHIYMSHTSNPNDEVHPNKIGTLKVAQIYANELLLIS